jgi:hypothetical protein
MEETYDEYYGSGKAEADWAEFIEDMFALNQETKENDE